MYTLPEKIKNLEPYEPDMGEYPIRLDANESFIRPTDEMLDRMAQAVREVAFNRYPDPLARGVCGRFADYYGIDSDCVTAGNGSDELIATIFSSLLQKGDKVITLTPDFSMYDFYASLAECDRVILEKDSDLQIDPDRLLAEAKDAKMLIFSNPCNPTAQGIKREDAVKIITSTDALVVLDEAYMDFWTESLLSRVREFDNLVILRTCSKMMGMAAARLGFAVAGEMLTKAIRAGKSPYNVNRLTQAVCSVILEDTDFLLQARETVVRSRDELRAGLKAMEKPGQIKVFDTCTNFVLIGFPDAAAALKRADRLKSQGILTRPIGRYIRITAGTEAENRAVIETMGLG